jgi:hypothetical protein
MPSALQIFFPLILYPRNATRHSFRLLNANFAIYSRDAHSFHLPGGFFLLIKSSWSLCLLEFAFNLLGIITFSNPSRRLCIIIEALSLYQPFSHIPPDYIFSGYQFHGTFLSRCVCLYRLVLGLQLVLFSLLELLKILYLCLSISYVSLIILLFYRLLDMLPLDSDS